MKRLCVFLAFAAALSAGDLFRDDFSRFPPGWLSQPVGQLNGAIQEYHYLAHRGVPLEPWFNPIVHQDAWIVSDEDGHPYLEQQGLTDRPEQFNAMLITGDAEWSDYEVEVKVKPLSFLDVAGVVFRYHTNRHYYVFGLRGGNQAVLRLRLPLEEQYHVAAFRELGAVRFPHDVKRYYTLKVVSNGARMRAFIDGRLMLEASDGDILKGKAGVTANAPARFMDFRVSASNETEASIRTRIAAREKELDGLRAANPRPVLWKKFDTPLFGAGRNVRFGDLDGDGRPEMLFGQNIPRVRGDAFDHLSCLTAVTLDGKILWQQGRPDRRNGLLTNDTPFQIHDIDGDGSNEVVLVRNFELQILDGRTGKRKKSAWMPPMATDLKERPYELNSGDSIAFLNLSGRKTPQEILVKDRYRDFWIYDNNLNLLWKGQGLTGHYPFPLDINGDGKEEFAIGYALWSPEGKRLWSRDAELKDHADGIAIGSFSGDPKARPMVYACGSDEGFLLFDLDGKILKHVRIGHAQSPSIARYRPGTPGLQLLTVNYWRNPGILSLFDYQGNLLIQDEPIHSGSPLLPVNWRGDGQEFALLSGNPREGGMVDGWLRRVVMFPDDGHPDLAANVLNLTGDARDEVVLWDQQSVWIYTQDRPFTGERIYAPVRSPDYNESNYRTTVSLPAWKDAPPAPPRTKEQPRSKDFRWPGGAKAAVALTYDDGVDVQLDHAIPDLEAVNLRGTFYIPGNSVSLRKRIAEWRAVAQRGHELGNHTLSHPCLKEAFGRARAWVGPEQDLDSYSITRIVNEVRVMNTLLNAVDGQQARTLAYTCGDETVRGVSFVDQIQPLVPAARAYRHAFRALADPVTLDPYRVPSWALIGNKGEEMIAWGEEAIRSGTLAVYTFHGVGGGHGINVDREAHQALLRWLNSNRAQVWTAPFVKIMAHVMAERQRLSTVK